MSWRFPIKVNGEIRSAELVLAGEGDLVALTRGGAWLKLGGNERLRDALEFSRLAAKRWRYYHRSGLAITDLGQLRHSIRREPQGEFGMMLLARPAWRSSSSVLGFCFVRRSWCHHLIVDFLGTHPRILGNKREHIQGVGTGVLYQLVGLADELGIACIWGEATADSAAFYQRTLAIRPVLDHFFIEGEAMEHCRKELRRTGENALAKPS